MPAGKSFALSGAAATFSHTFVDSGEYEIEFTVSAEGRATSTHFVPLTVANVAPRLRPTS